MAAVADPPKWRKVSKETQATSTPGAEGLSLDEVEVLRRIRATYNGAVEVKKRRGMIYLIEQHETTLPPSRQLKLIETGGLDPADK
jgi:hypothetical protein